MYEASLSFLKDHALGQSLFIIKNKRKRERERKGKQERKRKAMYCPFAMVSLNCQPAIA